MVELAKELHPSKSDPDAMTRTPRTATPTPGAPGSRVPATHLSALTPKAGAGEGMSGGDAPNA